MMNFKNEEAVSPVIGVILMVAITVILAAVIAAFVFGMTGNVQTQKNVAVGLQKDGTQLQVTIQGGADVASLQYLRVTIGNEVYYTPAGEGHTLAKGSVPATNSNLSVGKAFKTETTTGTPGPMSDANVRVIVVGHFSDGQEQMLTDRTL